MLLKSQDPKTGAWTGNLPDTAFAILFLVRGRNPVALNKLQYNVSSAPPEAAGKPPAKAANGKPAPPRRRRRPPRGRRSPRTGTNGRGTRRRSPGGSAGRSNGSSTGRPSTSPSRSRNCTTPPSSTSPATRTWPSPPPTRRSSSCSSSRGDARRQPRLRQQGVLRRLPPARRRAVPRLRVPHRAPRQPDLHQRAVPRLPVEGDARPGRNPQRRAVADDPPPRAGPGPVLPDALAGQQTGLLGADVRHRLLQRRPRRVPPQGGHVPRRPRPRRQAGQKPKGRPPAVQRQLGPRARRLDAPGGGPAQHPRRRRRRRRSHAGRREARQVVQARPPHRHRHVPPPRGGPGEN